MTTTLEEAAARAGASRPAPPARGPRVSWRRRERRIGLIATLPAFLIVMGFMVYPVLFAVYISFTRSDGATFEWVGLMNYVRILTDPLVASVFVTNLKFIVSVPLIVLFSLVVSVLLFERIRGWRFFRVVFFLPNVLSIVVVGIMFKSLFGYYGVVNGVIAGLGGQRVEFFTSGNLSILVIVLALVWAGFGYQALILLAGLSSIDSSVFEAAAIDGAGWWRRLWSITLPNIRREIGFVCIINVLYTFTSLFGFVFVMTAGGPGYETTTIDYLIYLKAFSSENIGPGAALAVLLFLFIAAATVLQNRFFRIQDED